MSTDLAERRTYPVYIMLDVSESMRRQRGTRRSPQAEFTALIRDLILALSDAPALAVTAWLSVIAFSDEAELLCPMTSLADPFNVRSPRDGVETNYAAALRFLRDRYDDDVLTIRATGHDHRFQARVARPLVFVVTDGAPYAADRYQPLTDWLPYRDRLVESPVEARVAAIGLEGAHPHTLWALATGTADGQRNAFIARPDACGDDLARSVTNVIQRSIKLSVRAGEMIIDEPAGMRRVVG